MLLAFPQFVADAPTLLAQVEGNRGIAVKPFVGAGDAFLTGFSLFMG